MYFRIERYREGDAPAEPFMNLSGGYATWSPQPVDEVDVLAKLMRYPKASP